MIAECFNDLARWSSDWTNSICNSNFSASWRCYSWKDPKEIEAEKLAHANECRRRDLSVLWIDPLPRNPQIRKPVLIRFQPMWSARRWRSVT